ncbi:DUF1993 domain-containing protein [Pseudomonas sp. CCI3.2]|uniref:DUF1993 domain-containing protein n=1 Tax=unclassified Pseudomonas TaxID=196821 RepID=UPI002AC99E0F|nr:MULTISPECIES: DUF1993 domain-containing protein [unclassified Pseudomonas]MEB0076231.1 DUF1993 domain-containing protein [Pseudomonas sp. MH10out]MEB0090726.1 DUF1993 domain-containing protein [Pseudomonas sp. CCI4.2]MEB0100596.1 DUF1993 domain-containing protein [Pseudomonas sp. CCI3.2]MEB0131902.1 DUF1993 domain-containing protein [Pseudomonas sp. CCI2.4]MEB0157964.1 DUF1993 domain-containing protein [Pseudomonas sp. AH2 (2023)]
MSLSYYQLSVPVFLRSLNNLSKWLDKAVEHATDNGTTIDELLQARLAPDMYTLTGQIQAASDASKLCTARLAGVTPPSYSDTETTLEQLRERIANTQAFIRSVTPEQYEANAGKTVTLKTPSQEMIFSQQDYLLNFAVPNFYFHLTTAYDILRHNGVAIGKLDFLGGI